MSEGIPDSRWFRWALVALYLLGVSSLPCLPRSYTAIHAQNCGQEQQEGRTFAYSGPQNRPITIGQIGQPAGEQGGKRKKCGGGFVCEVVWPRAFHVVDIATYEPTAFFTLVLAISTIGLWWVTERTLMHARADSERQARDMRASLVAATDASKAATKQASIAEAALTGLERPWIFRDLVTVTWRDRPGVQVNDWMVSIRWKNVGRAPALLTDFVFWMQDLDSLPPTPNYNGLNVLGVPDALPAKDDSEFNTQPAGPANGLRADGTPIQYVFWGRLRYTEMNGKEHTSGFALLLGTHFAVAASHNSDAYNYYT